jgi:hypothetical protein
MVDATTTRVGKDNAQLRALEAATQGGGPTNTTHATTLDANAMLAVVDVGGNQVSISVNLMFQKMREMEAKVEVLLEQAKNVGVLFDRWGFPSETEFALFHARKNPGSHGLAAFVDITSIWGAFEQAGTPDTTEFLNTAHRAKSVGLKCG